MSAVPWDTASKDSKGGTSSPAAKSLTSMRPSVPLVMRSASRCAPVPRPGKFFGQVVTILSCLLPCAMAGAGKFEAAAAATAAPAMAVPLRRLRRPIFVLMSLGLP